MKLLEIKNNLVKISYTEEDKLALAQFIALVDNNNSYVGQIVNLKADVTSNYAIAKLIFTFNNEGIVDNYDGSIPSMKAKLSYLDAKDILNLLPVERPIALGELAQQGKMVRVDQSLFEKNLTICAEKFDNICTIVKNCTAQLMQNNEKVVVIDVDHTFGEFEPVRFSRDFKLPLNAEMIDFIYENDLEGVDATSKAVIQDIFYEVQQYAKTVEDKFIPFDTFLKVVSQQYQQTDIPELALLKNKLLKYRDANVFAESKDDLEGLKTAVEMNAITYIDIAEVSDNLQKELISYIHKVLDTADTYMYVFVKLTNKNADKKLLKQLLDNEHIFTTVICSHNYKYLPELKQRAENLIFFAPQTVQHDFASYNTLLNKLNANEFIVYGVLTQSVPFIIELSEFTQDYTEEQEPKEVIEEIEEEPVAEPVREEVENDEPVSSSFDFDTEDEFEIQEQFEEPVFEETPEPDKEDLIEKVAKDVDEVFYTQPEQMPSIEDITANTDENLTEDDLDFIEDFSADTPMQEEHSLTDEEEPFVNETPFEEEHQLENPEVLEEEVITEEPVLEDIPTEFEIEADSSLDEPQPPVVPIYPAEEPVLSDETPLFEQGDMVTHPKYGKGVIEKMIKYGNKTLCSISFENVGRRLLDPAISELHKV